MALSLKITGGADHGSKTRAKAGDYDRATRSVIETAIEIYCAMLLGNDPYPVPVKEIEWARAAWDEACHHHHVNTPHDPALLKLITARTCHLRGQFKSKARPIVAAVYGFDTSADASAIGRNRALFQELKQDSAFIFRHRGQSLDEHTGIYMTPAIQQVINAVLFKNKNDDGIRWGRYYKPFPIVGFALTITAIECAINEWESGVREMIVFKEHEYSTVFGKHLGSLDEFNTMTASIGLLMKLLQRVYNHGCAHAGVMNPGVETGELKKAVPRRAFLNAIDEYKRMEGAMDLHVETEPEDNSDAEEHHDMDTGLEDLDPTDDLEDEQVGESDYD
ncbi:hypothetical protein V8E55_009132 [Tylopilus felleus]